MLLLIDNYDSFTYNLVHAFEEQGVTVTVARNDNATVKECIALQPDYLVIGPGPGTPGQSGISMPLIQKFADSTPILGVCLGLQSLAELYGGKVVRSRLGPMHGKNSRILHDGRTLFAGLPQGFTATRYHSLVVERESLPSCLEIAAETPEGEIMALRHKTLGIEGVQFHPEAVLTVSGPHLLNNFIKNR